MHAEKVVKGLPLLQEPVSRLVPEVWLQAEWTNNARAAQLGDNPEENMLKETQAIGKGRICEVESRSRLVESRAAIPIYHSLGASLAITHQPLAFS